MLVLSRQRDETIVIGDDIEVTIVDIRGGKVRLGINAPKGVPVHRKEVWLTIKQGDQSAPAPVRQRRPAGQTTMDGHRGPAVVSAS